MTWFVTSLRENPELAVFLTLALGFVIGGPGSGASVSATWWGRSSPASSSASST
jgi:hypothetical protein